MIALTIPTIADVSAPRFHPENPFVMRLVSCLLIGLLPPALCAAGGF